MIHRTITKKDTNLLKCGLTLLQAGQKLFTKNSKRDFELALRCFEDIPTDLINLIDESILKEFHYHDRLDFLRKLKENKFVFYIYKDFEDTIVDPQDLTVITKYMETEHYIDFLEKRSLYAHTVSDFEDGYEGKFPKIVEQRYLYAFRNFERDYNIIPDSLKKIIGILKSVARCLCFRKGDDSDKQSLRMWEGKDLAIVSTIKSLYESIENQECYYICHVNYIDHELAVPENNEYSTNFVFSPCVHKKLDYEYEKELRVLPRPDEICLPDKMVLKSHRIADNQISYFEKMYKQFHKVNVNRLIHEVIVKKDVSDEEFEQIKSITRKYGLNVNVRRSTIECV